MIYNTRNRSSDATGSQKENVHFQYNQSKIMVLNKMSLKGLAMLKCESRTSLHAVQYK